MATRRTRPSRKHPRLKLHDYAPGGGYFITFCTKDFKCFLSRVEADGTLILGIAGEIVDEEIRRTPEIRPEVQLIDHIVMPNHVHVIFSLSGDAATGRPHRYGDNVPGSISSIVGSIKSMATRRMRHLMKNPNVELWHDKFHDHVIRDESDLQRIREYVVNNPANWAQDRYHPHEIARRRRRSEMLEDRFPHKSQVA